MYAWENESLRKGDGLVEREGKHSTAEHGNEGERVRGRETVSTETGGIGRGEHDVQEEVRERGKGRNSHSHPA